VTEEGGERVRKCGRLLVNAEVLDSEGGACPRSSEAEVAISMKPDNEPADDGGGDGGDEQLLPRF
jgi:hypothetical protein